MKKLMEQAKQAYAHAYAPYSGIRIGACLQGKSGKTYTGCNMENASYGATICAERCAVAKAVSEGEREFTGIAVTGDLDGYAYPCGICRQVLSEFMDMDGKVAVGGRDRQDLVFTLGQLLPHHFEYTGKKEGT
ncbi:MAG: cytidine deaminase [Clostridia bacterium]